MRFHRGPFGWIQDLAILRPITVAVAEVSAGAALAAAVVGDAMAGAVVAAGLILRHHLLNQ